MTLPNGYIYIYMIDGFTLVVVIGGQFTGSKFSGGPFENADLLLARETRKRVFDDGYRGAGVFDL